MKKFKLFALTALLAMGTNAFAGPIGPAVDSYFGVSGAVYKVTTASDKDGDGKVTNGKVTFIGLGKDATSATIPATVTYTDGKSGDTYTYTVTSIRDNWATASGVTGADDKDVTVAKFITLTIAIDNLTDFAAEDYADFTKLTSLTITDGRAADKGAATTTPVFSALTALATLNLSGTKITTVANEACSGLAKLVTVNLPETVTTIGNKAFDGCKLLETAAIPAAVTSIGDYAFRGTAKYAPTFTALTKLATIGWYAFNGSAVATADLSATKVTAINGYAFENCEKLTSVTLSADLLTIGDAAFSGTKITTVAIPDKVTAIGTAFSNCAELATITGMKGLTGLADDAFKDDAKLTAVDLSANTGIAAASTLGNAFAGCEALASVKLPENVATLKDDLFKDQFESLVTFEAPGVSTIANAFIPGAKAAPNETLKTLVLGDVDLSAGSEFFYYTALETVTVGTANIGGTTFGYCDKLTTFTMTDGPVAAKAFYYCTGLKTFNYLDKIAGITDGNINNDAFLGCTAFVQIVTTGTFQAEHGDAPHQTKWATSASATMKTVADAGTSGKAFGIFENTSATHDVIVPVAEGLKMYSIYMDQGTAYFQALRQKNGNYYIQPRAHVVLKTDEPKSDIEYTTAATVPANKAVLIDEVITLNDGGDKYGVASTQLTKFTNNTEYTVADFQEKYMNAGEYLYRLTNKAPLGFGFTAYSGADMKAGQFFIVSDVKPAEAAGRLNIIWLDEDGNVESDATAIETVKQAVNDGVIYNMAGQQVDGNYKGIVIKNGKKVILK